MITRAVVTGKIIGYLNNELLLQELGVNQQADTLPADQTVRVNEASADLRKG
jgi:hypothetical protein